jgi:DNA-binding PadR family transcriptional regulator
MLTAMTPRRSVLAVAVLTMLAEAPMHAYRMQQLIKERHKDEVVNVAQRNSIYQTIERLLRDGLIVVQATEKAENRPERTVYEITQSGRDYMREWMLTMLSTPAREFPEFPAALAFLPIIPQEEVREALAQRALTLQSQLSAVDSEMTQAASFLPRIFLVESEYQRAVLQAELDYVKLMVADLDSGRLSWKF